MNTDKNMFFKKLLKLLLLFLGCFFWVHTYALTSYSFLEKKIKLKQFIQAYQYALKTRGENEGDPRFDYLYGLSALETGHYNEAVFSLDRVTISTPNVIRPRLELARAYLKLNNKIAAIKEFKDVLALSPPPIVRNKVSTYINELNKVKVIDSKPLIKRLASFSIGYDNNVNFGHDTSEVNLPGFGLVTLNPSIVKKRSGFSEAKFQLMRSFRSNRNKSSFVIGNISHRKYFKTTDFDFTDLDLRMGLSIIDNETQYQLIMRERPVFMDSHLYSNTLSLDAIAKKELSKGKMLSSLLSLDNYRHKRNSLNNRNRVTVGLKYGGAVGKGQYQLGIFIAKEFPNESAGKPLSRNIFGINYDSSYNWNIKNKSLLNLGYQNYKHRSEYNIFPEKKRKDNRFTIKVTHETKITSKATLVFSVKHISNKSNLNLYDAKRSEAKIGVRYEWD